LLQRNIRVDQRDTATNRSIEATCTGDDSKNFLHFNNGVTFLCESASYDGFQAGLTLDKAQVVNGGQTIRALYRARQKGLLKTDVLVPARAITSSGDKDFANNVAVNQNNQNQVGTGFLRSNDQRVVQLDHALAQKFLGAKLTNSYPDVASLFRKEKPDLALISMEAATSPPVIDTALEAGCHVLAEKPGCVHVEDFEKLNRKAKAHNRQLLLALANRVDPVMLEARRIFQEGKIGKLYGVEVHLIADQTRLTKPGYGKDWKAQKARSGGGHLIWLGMHWLDLAVFVTGLPVRAVTAFTANVGGQPFDVEDSAVVAMRFGNGSLGTLTSGYYLDKGYHSHLKVWGSQGWLQVHKHTEIPLEWYSTKDSNPQVQRWEKPKRRPETCTLSSSAR
jgi:predicted dehydrogenase